MLGILFIYTLPFSTGLFILCILAWATAWGLLFRKKRQKVSFFLFMILLVITLWGLLQLTPVQNWLTSKVTATLSRSLKTTVSIKHVEFGLFNKMSLEGLLIKDQKRDTLVYAGAANVNITDWFFFKDNATLKFVGLSNAIINVNRTDSVWNYQFLIDYFSNPKKRSGSKGGIAFDLQVLKFENVLFNKEDKWVGQDMKVAIAKLDLNADVINFDKKQVYISNL
ncbi:MAG: hypothetical protein ABIN74_08685, partial [Ferruginibacter sp.]